MIRRFSNLQKLYLWPVRVWVDKYITYFTGVSENFVSSGKGGSTSLRLALLILIKLVVSWRYFSAKCFYLSKAPKRLRIQTCVNEKYMIMPRLRFQRLKWQNYMLEHRNNFVTRFTGYELISLTSARIKYIFFKFQFDFCSIPKLIINF